MRISIVWAHGDSEGLADAGKISELVAPAAGLSRALAAGGQDVRVCVPAAAAGGGCDIGAFIDQLDDAWRANRPDVVHAQCWRSGIAAQMAARNYGIPVVQSFANPGGSDGDDDARRFMPLLARRAGWVTSGNTEDLFELLRMGATRARLSVIPAGVDSDVFRPPGPAATRAGLPHRVVSVWSADGRYDLDKAVRALAALPDTELVVAADASSGSLADVHALLRGLAGTAGVAHRVSVQEVRTAEDLASLLRSADVCAWTAVSEPTGVAALMAMACGVPVVGTAVGALVDIVVDEVTGRLVPVGNVPGFTDAVRRLLHEPFTGRGMGAAGRDRARSRYTWDRVAADAMRAYTGAANSVGVVSA